MQLPNEDNRPDWDWDIKQPCGHSSRYHKNQLEEKLKKGVNMNIEEFNLFVKQLNSSCGIQLHEKFGDNIASAISEIVNQQPEAIREILVEALTEYLEKQMNEYDKTPTLELAQSVTYIAQKLGKEFDWDLMVYRNDLYLRITAMFIENWKDLFPNVPMPL